MKAMVNGYRLLLAMLVLQVFTLHAQAQVTANFTTTGNKRGCSPLVVNFTNQSSGATQYTWRFGNGNQSSLVTPSVIYATPGKYSVTLIAINGAQSDTIFMPDYIEVFQDPSAGFAASVTNGCSPLPVNFTDQSVPGSAPIRAWIWNFGNGASSSQRNPTYVYGQGGNYNVTLLVVDQNGCSDEHVIPNYISTANMPDAQFSSNNRAACIAPHTVNFTNTSTPASGLNYLWTFGNGQTSNAQNPSSTYNSLGSYNVKLRVSNALGCTDSIVKPQYVVLQDLVANFTSNVTSGCAPLSVNFTNQTTSMPNIYRWDFGDGTFSTAANPTKVYNTPGTYAVKMYAANSSLCADSITKVAYITVNQAPVADFTANNRTGCRTPFVVGFSDISQGAVSWLWNFGDGSTSGQQNPVKVYTQTGRFNVSLSIVSAQGCTTTVTKNNFISIVPPVADFTADTTRGCFPINVNFTNTATANEPIASYRWDFGDGNISSQANPSHTYTLEGEYNVQLVVVTVSGCIDTIVRNNFIRAGSKPNAEFSATPDTVCLYAPVGFVNQTDISDQWFWQFGDGGISTEMSPQYTYGDTGLFTVNLIVWNKGCADTVEKIDYIYVSPPDARFNVVRDCSNPYQVQFVDTSLAPDTWFWNFGDGDSSYTQNPNHTFSAKGTYNVSLTVTDTISGCFDIYSTNILVVDALADFQASVTSGCHPLLVIMADSSLDANTYEWNAGGMASAARNPNFNFTTPGIYDVSLKVTDMLGCVDSLMIDDYITVLGPTPNFSASPQIGCAPLSVNFIDSSYAFISSIIDWRWSLGNGDSSTLQNPTTLYSNPGNYDISLTVTDTFGCSASRVANDFIQPTFPTPIFSGDTFSCSSRAVAFVNNSTGVGLQYLWDFGDGNTSTVASPAHNYALEGTYTISLRTIDINGCDSSVTKVNYVTVSNPIADFSADSTFAPCPPLLVNFSNGSSADIISYSWDFGDGNYSSIFEPSNVYLTPGNFDVRMIGTTAIGCKDTVVKNDFILVKGPDGTFTFDPKNSCLGRDVRFYAQTTNTQYTSWDFGDGNVEVNANDTFTYVYDDAGVYYPVVIIDDGLGCVRAITTNDSLVIGEIAADFASSTNYVCKQGNVQFADLSTGTPTVATWNWNFGDGQTSIMQNPLHAYTIPGNYDVELIITSSLCQDTIKKMSNIYIDPGPTADFTVNNNTGCDSMLVSFSDQSVSDSTIISFEWNFGNGQTASNRFVTAYYDTVGTYNASLIVTESTGCMDTMILPINVFQSPTLIATNDTFKCANVDLQLSVSGAVNYVWTSDEFLNNDSIANPITAADRTITYQVIGIDANGCFDNDAVVVTVNPIPNGSVVEDQDVCIGNAVELWAAGGMDYLWTPAATLDNDNTRNVVARPLQDTEYIVRIGNIHRCYDYDSVTVLVHPYPTGIAESIDSICYGSSTTINGGDGNDFLWSPSTGLSCTDCVEPTASPLTTTQYFLFTQNEHNCVVNDSIIIFVKPNAEANITAPQNICLGENLTLVASGGNNYNWLAPSSIACNNCNAQQQLTPLQTDTYIVRVNNEYDCPIVDSFTVNVRPLPEVATIETAKLCKGDDITLTTTIQGAVSQQWTPAAGLNKDNIASPLARPLVTTNYVITAQSAFGCESKDSVLIAVIEKVNTIVDGDFEICNGESTQLTTSIVEEGYTSTNVIWSPVNNLSNNTALAPIVNPNTTTTYTMIATSGSCIPDTQTIVVIVNNLPDVQIVKDRKVNTGTNINLSVNTESIIDEYNWQPADILSCNTCENPSFTANESQTVTVEVTDNNGCKNTDEAEIDVVGFCGDDVFIPNTFTPNGDEMNDKLFVRNLALDGLKIFRIFDRWGKLVFETTDINEGWDGRYKGVNLSTSVFAYYVEVICSNGQVRPKTGNVTLLR